MKHFAKTIVATAIASLSTIAATMATTMAVAADNQAASQLPPANIAVADAPQLVAIAFDDNSVAGSVEVGGMNWVLDLYANLQNPAGNGNLDTFDGLSPKTTFFNACKYIAAGAPNADLVKASWQAAVDAGHEIGNHSIDHLYGNWMDEAVWTAQIDGCNQILQDEIGASPAGFRPPYLDYNDAMFTTLSNIGMTYSASVEEGYQWDHNGTNYVWPYTLDNGSPGGDVVASWGLKPQIGQHPALWELPVYAAIVPPDDKAADYGLDYSLRDKMNAKFSWFDVNAGKVSSFDYNLFFLFELSKNEVLAIMKYTLDLRLQGNRAPMTFGLHSDYYVNGWDTAAHTAAERREVIEEFVQYALSKPEVRIVSQQQVIDWMRKPTELNAEHCYHSDWSQTQAYNQDDKVIYQDALWSANWWSFNTAPTGADWTPWSKVMDCK